MEIMLNMVRVGKLKCWMVTFIQHEEHLEDLIEKGKFKFFLIEEWRERNIKIKMLILNIQ